MRDLGLKNRVVSWESENSYEMMRSGRAALPKNGELPKKLKRLPKSRGR